MSKEVNWDFVNEAGDLLEACDKAARRASREWEEMEYEDAYQEAVIWLATHPEIQAQYGKRYQNTSHMADRIYINGLRNLCIKESHFGMTGLPYDENRNLVPLAPDTRVELSDLV